MTPEEAEKFNAEQSQALASKKTLLLTVNLDTPEQAEELLRWLYADEKPMKANLVEIAWDKTAIPKKLAHAVEGMRLAFAG